MEGLPGSRDCVQDSKMRCIQQSVMSGSMHLAGLEPKREVEATVLLSDFTLAKPDRATSADHGGRRNLTNAPNALGGPPPDRSHLPPLSPNFHSHLRQQPVFVAQLHQPTSSPPSPPSASDNVYNSPSTTIY